MYPTQLKQEVLAKYHSGGYSKSKLVAEYGLSLPTFNYWLKKEAEICIKETGANNELPCLPGKDFYTSLSIRVRVDDRGGIEAPDAIAYLRSAEVSLEDYKNFVVLLDSTKLVTEGKMQEGYNKLNVRISSLQKESAKHKQEAKKYKKLAAKQEKAVAKRDKALSKYAMNTKSLEKSISLLKKASALWQEDQSNEER